MRLAGQGRRGAWEVREPASILTFSSCRKALALAGQPSSKEEGLRAWERKAQDIGGEGWPPTAPQGWSKKRAPVAQAQGWVLRTNSLPACGQGWGHWPQDTVMGQFSTGERPRGPSSPLPTSALSMPIPHTERRPDIWGTPGGKGRAARSRQTCWVEGGRHAPPPRSSPAPLFLGPLLSIVGCISFPTPSPEKQLGFLQAKPSRLPQSWCVGACTLPNRHDISELSSKWISRLRHVSKGGGGGAGWGGA